ncbi:hypothetical protein [Insolitispirillum peregrinum]|uniref:Uncharacterized protein n=1 Tax=Insolitispirillum peregrinum TaxID=80876 RepID=A0A1N7KGI1_9PROT|nr:hypothetical protein [Insolitispirillum peregrinum]SIS60685.1 hypothetical protein SAMN05421779_102767 [Insolitispirillum peregrinum]
MQNRDALSLARETRRHAEAFHDVVRRFEHEMPDHLDRFHQSLAALKATRATYLKSLQ